MFGGQLAPQATTQARWYLSDLEGAEHAADNGDLGAAARLMKAARRDGVFTGVLSTRTGGLVGLPKRFRGDPEVIAELNNEAQPRSGFDDMFPPAELALLAADGLLLGVGVGELVDVPGRDFPVLIRLDPEFLQYQWNENRWYYRGVGGRIAIEPGDGRWILHVPGGRMCPWATGLWRSIGRSYIRKEHAQLHKDNYEAKLANPARVAVAPQGAAEQQKDSFFRQVMAWGINTVFGMTPGYDVKLLESNGNGWDAFDSTIQAQNNEIIIAVAGQTVTTGTNTGASFLNQDIHKTIRADLIKDTADGLSYTVSTQGLPIFIERRFGADALDRRTVVYEYDVTPPKDLNAEATALVTVGNAVTTLVQALALVGTQPDVPVLAKRFGVPILGDEDGSGEADDDVASNAPALRLIQGGSTGVEDDDVEAPGAITVSDDANPDAQSEADTALNGAQVTSMVEIVRAVAVGEIPRESGIAILERAFNLSHEDAESIIGPPGFEPAAPEPTATDDAAAAAPPPVDDSEAA